MPITKKDLICGTQSELIEHFNTFVQPTPENFSNWLNKNEIPESWIGKFFNLESISVENQIKDLKKRKVFLGVIFFYHLFEDTDGGVILETISSYISINDKDIIDEMFKIPEKPINKESNLILTL